MKNKKNKNIRSSVSAVDIVIIVGYCAALALILMAAVVRDGAPTG